MTDIPYGARVGKTGRIEFVTGPDSYFQLFVQDGRLVVRGLNIGGSDRLRVWPHSSNQVEVDFEE